MNRKDQIYGYGANLVVAAASFMGGGNTANGILCTDTQAKKQTNAGLTMTRTAEGVYDVVFAEGSMPPRVIAILPICAGAGHKAEVTTEYVAATRTVVITTRNAATTADDLPTTDKLILVVLGQDSTA